LALIATSTLASIVTVLRAFVVVAMCDAFIGCSHKKPLPERWTLSISSSAGSSFCEDTDTRACTHTWTLNESGPLEHVQQFRGGAITTTPIAESAEWRAKVEDILRTPAFAEAIVTGLPCTSRAAHDMWTYLTFVDREAGTKHTQSVAVCVLDKADNVLVHLTSALTGS
jgi:hypothetical protein